MSAVLLSAASRRGGAALLWRPASAASATAISVGNHCWQSSRNGNSSLDILRQQQQHRTMVIKASGKPEYIVEEKKRLEALGYWERKKALKEKRRRVYQEQQERKERVKVRRAGHARGVKQKEFRSFFIRKKVDEEYMHRKARQAGMDWVYQISAIVLRDNIVMPDWKTWEKEYMLLRDHLDLYGKVYPKELAGKQSIEDFKPMTEEELIAALPFTPAPRETEADHSGDVRTTNRRLKDNVYLLVQQKPPPQQDGGGGSDDDSSQSNIKWQFPTVILQPDETCMEAARRAVLEVAGDELEILCYSNCPWSVELTPYSPDQQQETGLYGIKNFFMLVDYNEGQVVAPGSGGSNSRLLDFAWLDRGEVVERIREQDGERQSKLYHYML